MPTSNTCHTFETSKYTHTRSSTTEVTQKAYNHVLMCHNQHVSPSRPKHCPIVNSTVKLSTSTTVFLFLKQLTNKIQHPLLPVPIPKLVPHIASQTEASRCSQIKLAITHKPDPLLAHTIFHEVKKKNRASCKPASLFAQYGPRFLHRETLVILASRLRLFH